MAKQDFQEIARPRLGPRRVAVTGFFGEGEAGQPVEEIEAGRGQHAVLREMDMGIDKAGKDQAAGPVIDFKPGKAFRQVGARACPGDAPGGIHRHRAAGDVARGDAVAVMAGAGIEGDDVAHQDAGVHGLTRSSMRKAKMRITCSSAVVNSTSGACFSLASKA